MTAPSLGTCFGFEIRSSLAFQYLRGGTGTPLAVSAPARSEPEARECLVREWTAVPGEQLQAKLYGVGGTHRLWIEEIGWFEIDPEASSIALPDSDDLVRREERLWGIPALLAFVARGDVPLHSAAVEVDESAVLLAAPSRLGKTTLAAGFHLAGCRLLAEDLSCLRIDGSASVVPGPAMLRVRHDVAARLDLSRLERVDESEDRVHFALPAADRGDCEAVPIRAVVLLHESRNGIRLSRSPMADAIRDLWTLSFKLPTEADLARSFAAVTTLADTVPVWNLERPLTLDLLGDAVHAVLDRV
jgi:hypothetical protein